MITSHIKLNGPSKSRYISEYLTFNAKKLYYLARDYANHFSYCWTSNGGMFLRKFEGSFIIKINSEGDLASVKDRYVKDRYKICYVFYSCPINSYYLHGFHQLSGLLDSTPLLLFIISKILLHLHTQPHKLQKYTSTNTYSKHPNNDQYYHMQSIPVQ